MNIYKNAQENPSGSIDCLILLNDEWVSTTQDPALKYKLSEELGAGDWADIKPCPQAKKDAHEQELIDRNSKAYLSSTDWYVMRAMDSGEPIPDDVKKKRAEARAAIKC